MADKKRRVVFIDQVRALAVVMMLIGHSLDRFLAETWKATDIYRNYQFVRGLSSALFLTVAGFSLVIASFGRMEEYTRLSDRMKARIRRVAFILFLGGVLQVPSATLSGMLRIDDPVRWERFFSFNVLQNIGFGLALLHLLLYFTRSARRFAVAAGIGAVVIFALASLTYQPAVDAALPFFLRGAVNLFHFSRFPMIPLTGFVFIGALFGVAYWQFRDSAGEKWVFVSAAATGGLLVIFEQLIRGGMLGGLFPYATMEPHTPGNTFARLGCALLIISSFYLLNRYRTVLAGQALTMSREALSIYFVHLMLVYGSAHIRGILSSMAHRMNPFQAALFVFGLISLMFGMAKLLGYAKRRNNKRVVELRRTALLAAGLIFLFLNHMSLVGAALCGGAAAAFTYRRPLVQHLLNVRRTLKKVS